MWCRRALVVAAFGHDAAVAVMLTDGVSNYEEYRKQFRNSDDFDAVSYAEREAVFNSNVAAIDAHNARSGVSYTMAINEFTDNTEAEFQYMLGYKRSGPRWAQAAAATGFLEITSEESTDESTTNFSRPVVDMSSETAAVNWRTNLTKSAVMFRNQGACGSCWAVAAAGAIEMHAELNSGSTVRVSHIQLVNCVLNPHHCGGDGGCKGATTELAFQYLQDNGIVAENDGAFKRQDAKCTTPQGASVIKSTGFKTLPINKQQPMIDALMQVGPLTVSVDGSPWMGYSQGVFDGCDVNAIVNHAVLATGFGTAGGVQYWTIRNSWGAAWGEGGYMRIKRFETDLGKEGFCGMDNKPKEGVFCEDAPAEVPVCGMCGILSDVAYPIGVELVEGQ